MDGLIEHNISNLIQHQFPKLYAQEGPVFVSFVTEYFKWLESSGNALYHSRRLYDYKDIDATADEFLLYFKEKYLKQIKLTTFTNTRQLIKHSLDLYRSKGTERGIDLLFRAVFGVETDIYYPGDDIFRVSDGKWMIPRYLEVGLNNGNHLFINKQIHGLTSKATAFVEQVVRRSVKGKFVDLLYISAINGNFETGETVSDGVRDPRDCPAVVGSLTSIVVPLSGVGSNFEVGDIVLVKSVNGEQARARVTNISDITGIIGVELLFGGYGYTVDAHVLVSEKLLTIANVHSTLDTTYFGLFTLVTQPIANIHYENLVGGTFANGDAVFTYHANNDLKGEGKILVTGTTNSTAGELFVTVYSGSLDDNTIWTTANAVSANSTVANGYYDRTVTANIIGTSANLNIDVTDISGEFIRWEEVTQEGGANAQFLVLSNSVVTNGTLRLIGAATNHSFQIGGLIRGTISNATAVVDNLTVDIGVINVAPDFVTTNGNFFYSTDISGNVIANGTVIDIGTGTGCSMELDTLTHTETVALNADWIKDRLTMELDADEYEFPAMPTGNLTNGTIHDITPLVSYDIGKVSALTSISPGINYNKAPIITIYEPLTFPHKERDGILHVSQSGSFLDGEMITQEATDGRGIIKHANAEVITYERLRLADDMDFIPTTNATTLIVGELSGATANVDYVAVDPTSGHIGYNAIIDNSVQAGVGAITGLDIIDSGFGYQQSEQVELEREDDETFTAFGTVILETQGTGSGFYKDRGGFVSDQKKVFDGYYYQEYSYEIRSSLALDKYIDMLKQVMHVAGTKVFGALIHKSIMPSTVDSKAVEILIS